MKYYVSIATVVTFMFIFSSCDKDEPANGPNPNPGPDPDIVVVKANGSIEDELDSFRHLLGDQLNTTPGAIGGRREINWEGVPDAWLGVKLPEDFFNPTGPIAPVANQRGLQYASVGRIQVSKTNFVEVNSEAAAELIPFSGTRSFANTTVNDWEVGFEIPGQDIPAGVRGFGAVFSDVDLANSTSLEFFNGNKSLGKYFVPARNGHSSFSFLGIYFKNNERITRIRVSHEGKLADGQKDISGNGPKDLVVMDDLLYSEPVE